MLRFNTSREAPGVVPREMGTKCGSCIWGTALLTTKKKIVVHISSSYSVCCFVFFFLIKKTFWFLSTLYVMKYTTWCICVCRNKLWNQWYMMMEKHAIIVIIAAVSQWVVHLPAITQLTNEWSVSVYTFVFSFVRKYCCTELWNWSIFIFMLVSSEFLSRHIILTYETD